MLMKLSLVNITNMKLNIFKDHKVIAVLGKFLLTGGEDLILLDDCYWIESNRIKFNSDHFNATVSPTRTEEKKGIKW